MTFSGKYLGFISQELYVAVVQAFKTCYKKGQDMYNVQYYTSLHLNEEKIGTKNNIF